MNYDLLFIITMLMVSIIILGFVMPAIGMALAVIWTVYGTTRFIQGLAHRKNVS